MLNNKIVRDEESIEMLEIIFNSRIYDVAYTYNWGSLRSLTSIFTSDSGAIASKLDEIKSAAVGAYEKVYSD